MSLSKDNNTFGEQELQSKTCAVYVRVSTGRQEQEATIESQLAEIKEFVKKEKLILQEENIFVDDGWTGSVLERPSLDAMRDAVMDGKFEVLVVYDRGRLSRDFVHQEVLIRELEEKGVVFESLHDVQAKDDAGKLMQSVMGIFHEYERVKIAERFRRGKIYKSKQGVLINGQAKYGWNYVRKTDNQPARYEVNKEEAEAVRLIWRWFGNDNLSINEIRRKLHDFGIMPRKRKNDYWAKTQIVRVLKCESYVTGVVHYNKSEAVIPKNPTKKVKYKKVKRTSRKQRPEDEWIAIKVADPIIKDRNLYRVICKKLERNKRFARKNRKHEYLLSGVLQCECGLPRCGDGQNKEGHFYYRCSERVNKVSQKDRKCKARGINAQVLDKTVWGKLTALLSDPDLLRKHGKEWLHKTQRNTVSENVKDKLNETLKSLDHEEERYSKAYGADIINFKRYSGLMKDLKKRRKSVNKQIQELSSKDVARGVKVGVGELVTEAVNVIKSLELKDKKQVIHDIIDKIIVTERRRVEVWGHIPLNTSPLALKLGYEPIGGDSGVA